MGDIVKVSWSGGKDSTCAVMLHLLRGDMVKVVCYIPMFTAEIPLINKEHYQFILDTADKFRGKGAEVHIVSGMTYWDFVTHRKTKGAYKGEIMGFPLFVTRMCKFRDRSKLPALKKNVGQFDYEDIGIAVDETDRHSQLTSNLRSILVESGYTESMAWNFCKNHNVLSPHYKFSHRDGCALCPHAKKEERVQWFADYPEAIPLVIELQELVKKERIGMTPLRNHEWFIDTDQITFFD